MSFWEFDMWRMWHLTNELPRVCTEKDLALFWRFAGATRLDESVPANSRSECSDPGCHSYHSQHGAAVVFRQHHHHNTCEWIVFPEKLTWDRRILLFEHFSQSFQKFASFYLFDDYILENASFCHSSITNLFLFLLITLTFWYASNSLCHYNVCCCIFSSHQANAQASFDIMSAIPGLAPIMPAGAMYMMTRVDMEHFPEFQDDLSFTSQLVSEQSVFCLPGQVQTTLCIIYGNVQDRNNSKFGNFRNALLKRALFACKNHQSRATDIVLTNTTMFENKKMLLLEDHSETSRRKTFH